MPGASWLGHIFRSISLEQRLNHPNSLPTSPAPGCRASAHIPRGQVDGTQGHGKGLLTGSRARTWEEGGRCRNLAGTSLTGPRALASLRSSSRQCFSSALPLRGRGALGSGLWWPPVCRKAPLPTQRQVPTPEQEERGRLSKGGLRGNRDTPLQEPLSQVWEEGEAGPSRSHRLHHTPLPQAETSCRVAASAWRR